jgi:hypothetical protein
MRRARGLVSGAQRADQCLEEKPPLGPNTQVLTRRYEAATAPTELDWVTAGSGDGRTERTLGSAFEDNARIPAHPGERGGAQLDDSDLQLRDERLAGAAAARM